MDAAIEGIEPILDDEHVRRNIFAPHMESERTGIRSLFGFPNAFEFQSRRGSRVESVVWGKHATPEQTIVLGFEMAEAKRLAKMEADPDISADRLPCYAGYLQAEVGLIRANAYLGVATRPGERRCIPDLFDVVHLPENGVHAHAHVVLSENYVDAIKIQMALDGSPGVENVTKKLAFPMAINMLLATLELSGFFCHNGDHIPCSAIV